jgi:hypothetical protein
MRLAEKLDWKGLNADTITQIFDIFHSSVITEGEENLLRS